MIKSKLWFLKGEVLPTNPRGLERKPIDTRLRLRVDFMDSEPTTRSLFTSIRLQRRISGLHRVLSERGGAQLGVRRISNRNGNGFRFSLRRITDMLTFTAPELDRLLADLSQISIRFSGKISYSARIETKGKV